MTRSVLDAIKLGMWDFEPMEVVAGEFCATHALPGSEEKLAVLAERMRQGLPLWHPNDRRRYDDPVPVGAVASALLGQKPSAEPKQTAVALCTLAEDKEESFCEEGPV